MYLRFKILLLLLIFPLVSWGQKSASPFSNAEINTVYAGGADEPMRVLKITNYADSIFLRRPSMPVIANPKDTVLQLFIKRMFRTVRDSSSLGVGIAAPQVGIPRQIIWVQRFDKEEEGAPFEVYLNPKIIKYSDTTKLTTEGCLSIPDRREKVNRPCSIVIDYDDLDGQHHQETISGFTSVIFQHEIDHLAGILYLDHLRQEEEEQKIKDKRQKKP